MKEKNARRKITFREIIAILICVVLILLSLTFGRCTLSSTEFHQSTLDVLDRQKAEALTLSLAVSGAATALSAIPDDTGSPVATELAKLATPLFLIVAIIYLEIFLLTTFGWVASTILFPGACLFTIAFVYTRKECFLPLIKKFVILALTLSMLIPASTFVTTKIEETFLESVEQKMHAASHIVNAAESEEKESNGFFSFFSGLADNVTAMVDAAKNICSTMIDAVAILVITSCIIPMLTLLFFVWIIKVTLSLPIPMHCLSVLFPPTGNIVSKNVNAIKEGID